MESESKESQIYRLKLTFRDRKETNNGSGDAVNGVIYGVYWTN